MNRNTTVIVLCGLLLVADAICIRQAFNVYNDLTPARVALLLTGQVLMAFFLGTVVYTVARKTFQLRKRVTSRQALGPLQPLRRLLATVWS